MANADDKVKVYVSGKIYEGWEDASITRNLESISGGFGLAATDKWRPVQEAWPLKPGNEIRIDIGSDRVLTGYIDSLDTNFDPDNRSITLNGRDKAGDLVDCSIESTSNEFKNITLLKLAQKLVEPFGISVSSKVYIESPFSSWSVKQGETVFENLERAARLRSVLFISDGNGNLVITRKGQNRASSEIVQGVNLLSGSATYDHSDRFSKYIVKGQSAGTDEFYGEKAASPKGEAHDDGVTRYRPMVMLSEGNTDNLTATERAKWEASIRATHGDRITLTVQGWRQKDGRLWTINEIVKVRSGLLGLDKDMLISATVFKKGNNGTITEIEVTRADAYEPVPRLKKKSDPVDDLGWE